MSKHTPGPWRIPAGSHLEIASGMSLVATVAEAPNGAANARLIAAAPDLVAALHRLLLWHDSMGGWESPAWDAARAALAKAEGGAP